MLDTGDGHARSEPWVVSVGRAARHYAVLLVAVVMVTTAIAVGITATQKTTYTSRTNLVLQTAAGPADSETIIRTIEALVSTDAVGAKIRTAANLSLTPQQIVSRITVKRPPGSGLIAVDVTDSNAARSVAIAGKLPAIFEAQVSQLTPAGTTSANAVKATSAYTVSSWAGGAVFTTTNHPPYLRNGLIGFVLGLVLVVAFLAVRAQYRQVYVEPVVPERPLAETFRAT
jgi:capsular polysaccharide biosynthesis protein